MTYSDLQSHRFMALDLPRNKSYFEAMKRLITPDTVVLDLGAGLGVHGLLAAKLGAKHVYLVEPENIGSLAVEVASSNQLRDKITWLQGRIEEIDLPEKVDLIISVLTGNFLLNEDLLGSLFLARDKWLKKGGYLLPDKAEMYAVPVHVPKLYRDRVGIWSKRHLNLDFSSCRRLASNEVMMVNTRCIPKQVYLSDPKSIKSANFNHYNEEDTKLVSVVDFQVEQNKSCHGIIGWFDLCLDGEWISTAPHAEKMHWSPLFFPIDPPLDIERNNRESLKVSVQRFPRGSWNWQVKIADQTRSHSTFLPSFYKHNQMPSAKSNFVPNLNKQGQIVNFILQQFNGEKSLEQLTKDAQYMWSEEMDVNSISDLVADLASRYANCSS